MVLGILGVGGGRAGWLLYFGGLGLMWWLWITYSSSGGLECCLLGTSWCIGCVMAHKEQCGMI